MNSDTDDFCKALSLTFSNYKEFGARSNKKLKPIHAWIGQEISKRLDKSYSVHWVDHPNEDTIEGKYLPKRVDISVLQKGKPKGVVSFKFVTSNYSQNNVNYFENLIGECANLKMAGIPFGHIFVLRDVIPYYKKDGDISKFEKVTDHNLKKYIELSKDSNLMHSPNAMAIIIISVDESNNYVCYADITKLGLSEESQEFLRSATINNFIDKFVALL